MILSEAEEEATREVFVAVQMLNAALKKAGNLRVEVRLSGVPYGINQVYTVMMKSRLTGMAGYDDDE